MNFRGENNGLKLLLIAESYHYDWADATGVDLSKILWQTKILEERVAITDISLAFLNYWGNAPELTPPKFTPMAVAKN